MWSLAFACRARRWRPVARWRPKFALRDLVLVVAALAAAQALLPLMIIGTGLDGSELERVGAVLPLMLNACLMASGAVAWSLVALRERFGPRGRWTPWLRDSGLVLTILLSSFVTLLAAPAPLGAMYDHPDGPSGAVLDAWQKQSLPPPFT